MVYLFKLTVAWAFFLLLFELLYKGSGKYTANRVYLLLGISLALLLPLISLPSNTPVTIPSVINIPQKFRANSTNPVQQGVSSATVPTTAESNTRTPDLKLIISIIYAIGIVVFAVKSIVELVKIMRLIQRKRVQILFTHKVIVTDKIHSPYSFMGYIFITDVTSYNSQELEYIIKHESAHNAGKHWFDLWIVQLICMAFWFHPLVWRYRYLLLLQHEYEADEIAANNDPYAYGHFLLGQTLLNGVPSVAHSFHFSPIKNRINMLAKKHSLKPGNWKYILVAPALISCTFLMAKTAAKTDRILNKNEIAFNDNIFTRRDTSMLTYDKTKVTRQIVSGMNREPVYQNRSLTTKATYGNNADAYRDYITKQFSALCKKTSDSLAGVSIYGLVIDKKGKVVYYEVEYVRPFSTYMENQKKLYPFHKPEPMLEGFMEQVMSESPAWEPAMIDGKPVNSFIAFSGGC